MQSGTSPLRPSSGWAERARDPRYAVNSGTEELRQAHLTSHQLPLAIDRNGSDGANLRKKLVPILRTGGASIA
jgi:hypothetical protein